jgi:hypothetical protein
VATQQTLTALVSPAGVPSACMSQSIARVIMSAMQAGRGAQFRGCGGLLSTSDLPRRWPLGLACTQVCVAGVSLISLHDDICCERPMLLMMAHDMTTGTSASSWAAHHHVHWCTPCAVLCLITHQGPHTRSQGMPRLGRQDRNPGSFSILASYTTADSNSSTTQGKRQSTCPPEAERSRQVQGTLCS